jgi:anti-anti-sigma factor
MTALGGSRLAPAGPPALGRDDVDPTEDDHARKHAPTHLDIAGSTGALVAVQLAHPLTGPHGAPQPFRCEVRPARHRAYVQPAGDLDMATVPQVESMLDQLHRDGFGELVLDLRGVTFMDSSGLHLVLRWASISPRLGVVPGNEQVRRLFELTRSDGLLRLVERPEVDPA